MIIAFGIALLMPWNATMATMDYFIKIFPSYKPSFTFLLAVTGPMLGMQVVSFVLQSYISVEFKLSASLIVNSLVTILMAIVPETVTSESTRYYIILTLMIIQGSAIAFL